MRVGVEHTHVVCRLARHVQLCVYCVFKCARVHVCVHVCTFVYIQSRGQKVWEVTTKCCAQGIIAQGTNTQGPKSKLTHKGLSHN